MVVGRALRSTFTPAALALSRTSCASRLIVSIALVGQLDLAVEEEVPLAVDVQHEPVGGDPLARPRSAAPSRPPAAGPAGRNCRC